MVFARVRGRLRALLPEQRCYLSREWRKARDPVIELLGSLAIPVFFAFAEWRLGLSIVSCDCHSAGSAEKAYTGPTRFFCCVCGSGVWGGLPGSLGRGVSVDSEQHIWNVIGGLRCLCGYCCC